MLMVSSAYPPTLVLLLPLPPGSNHRLMPVVVKGKRRLALTPEAREWLLTARDEVFFQRSGRFVIANRTAARISLPASGYDADAPIKLLFDGIEDGGAVLNDRQIEPYFVCRDATVPHGRIKVELWDTGEAMPARGRTLTAEEAHRSMVNRALARTFR